MTIQHIRDSIKTLLVGFSRCSTEESFRCNVKNISEMSHTRRARKMIPHHLGHQKKYPQPLARHIVANLIFFL